MSTLHVQTISQLTTTTDSIKHPDMQDCHDQLTAVQDILAGALFFLLTRFANTRTQEVIGGRLMKFGEMV